MYFLFVIDQETDKGVSAVCQPAYLPAIMILYNDFRGGTVAANCDFRFALIGGNAFQAIGPIARRKETAAAMS